MRLLADQDVYSRTVEYVRTLGHDLATVAELDLSTATDLAVLNAAITDQRILVTRDRDFGSLVFANAMRGGVIYLRTSPATLNAVHDELKRVLSNYQESELLRALIVIEPGRHRLRKVT